MQPNLNAMQQLSRNRFIFLAVFSVLFLVIPRANAQWKEIVRTWMLTRQGGDVPLYIQFVDHTNKLGVYGDFDSAKVDNSYSVPNLGNTLTLTNAGWKNAGYAYNYSSAYSYVYFHNKLFGGDYIVHTEKPYFAKLNTATNTYEDYPDFTKSLANLFQPNFRFFQWKTNVLVVGHVSFTNSVDNVALWNMKSNSYHKVGGGAFGYDAQYINSIDISASDSTVAFICGNSNDPANGLRVLHYGDSVWASNYPPVPDGAKRIEVANKNEMYVVVNSTDVTKKVTAIYMLNMKNKTWDKIISLKMTNRLLYPDIYSLAYGNGALHFIGSFDSCNSKTYSRFTTLHYIHETGNLEATDASGLNLSCVDDNPLYNRLFFVNNSLYLAASGGLCGLQGQASLYELPYKAVLPVIISSFTAENIGEANRLQWQTMPSGIKAFTIERSTDAKNFVPIGSESVKTLSGTQQVYTFIDDKPERPISYYRLQCLEADGAITYTDIRKVNSSIANFSATVLSNIVHSQVTITLASNIQTKVNVSIFSLAGAPLSQQSFSISAGVTHTTVDVSRLSSGMYVIKVQGSTKTVDLKFLKF